MKPLKELRVFTVLVSVAPLLDRHGPAALDPFDEAVVVRFDADFVKTQASDHCK